MQIDFMQGIKVTYAPSLNGLRFGQVGGNRTVCKFLFTANVFHHSFNKGA